MSASSRSKLRVVTGGSGSAEPVSSKPATGTRRLPLARKRQAAKHVRVDLGNLDLGDHRTRVSGPELVHRHPKLVATRL